jgi:hypothetical protein
MICPPLQNPFNNEQSVDRYQDFMKFKKTNPEPHPTSDHAKDARTSKPGFWAK